MVCAEWEFEMISGLLALWSIARAAGTCQTTVSGTKVRDEPRFQREMAFYQSECEEPEVGQGDHLVPVGQR